MNKIIAFCFCVVALAACNDKKAGLQPAPIKSHQSEGGLSGGGGGTLPANPIGIWQVFDVVSEAKVNLRFYFNYERKYNWENQMPQLKYYFGENNLSTQLEKTDIEVLTDKACKDIAGRSVDASVVASRPNTICLSAFRVAPKLIAETAKKEILALIIHELSHFLGATEDEAIDIQQGAAIQLAKLSSESDTRNKYGAIDFSDDLSSFFATKGALVDNIKSGALPEITDGLMQLVEKSDYDKELGEATIAYTDYLMRDYEDVLQAEVNLGWYYVNSILNSQMSHYAAQLDKCFGKKDVVTVTELANNCFMGVRKDNIYGDILISRNKSLTELLPIVSRTYLYIHDLSAHVRATAFNQPLPFFNLPTNQNKPNPWANFIGNYSTKLVSCSSHWPNDYNPFQNITNIEIYSEVLDYPSEGQKVIYVKQATAGGYSSYPLYNGAFGNGAVKVSGDLNLAIATDESGTRWYDRQMHGWSRLVRTMSRNSQNEIFLNLKFESFSDTYKGVTESSYECEFQLTK